MAFVFPVVGATEWSGGSYMDKHTKGDRSHHAIDIYAETGSSIVAPMSGKVTGTGSAGLGGNWIRIQGDDGNTYYFAHMNTPTHLEVGASVNGGSAVGSVGNSGSARTTKPHLHFSMKRDGVSVNPIEALRTAVLVPAAGPAYMTDEMKRARSIRWGEVYGGNQMYDDEPVPSVADQLAAYREQQTGDGVSPTKQRASSVVRGSLQGMANMVKQHGFDTGTGGLTGIAEIDREGDR